MNTKLILKMDDSVIEAAKLFAKNHNTSVSKLAENYFKLISRTKISDKEKIPGIVGELAGFMKDIDVASFKNNYIDYLDEKYK